MERVILHSDLNNCYASIECMLHPELRGKYIAVCGSTEERHGIVLAKNQLPVFIDDIHANAVGYMLLYQSEVKANGR